VLHREIGDHYHSCCANNPGSPYSNAAQCLTDCYFPDYLPSTPCCRNKMRNFHVHTSSITNPKKVVRECDVGLACGCLLQAITYMQKE